METNDLMRRLARSTGVGRAFGPSFEKGDMLVIPVAVVAGGGGYGATERSDEPNPHAPPPGTGGGAGGVSLPLGVYEVTADRVRFVPAFDVTRMVVAAIGLIKFAVGMWRRVADRRAAQH